MRTKRQAQKSKDVRPRWSKSELSYLQREYDDHSNDHIAKKLGRSTRSVCAMAGRLGLKKTLEHRSKVGRRNIRNRWDN